MDTVNLGLIAVPVRVPFHLRRRAEPAPAVALLLLSDNPAALLAACARLTDPLVCPVANGFILVADSIPEVVPATIRLRRLSENCLLPTDADLVPALRPAEAVDLTAKNGLVFLPNREPLLFDATSPLKPAAFLAVRKPRRDDWEPFPVGNPPADRLTALVREITIPPDEMLEADGPAIGTDDARPPQVGPGRRVAGHVSAGLGKGLGALGRALGSSKLARLGGKLAGLGAALAPRITEGLLGKQEAALQQLLKKFRSGATDDALRKAIPIGGDPGRGGGVYGSDRLPTNNWKWSFGSLFGSGGSSGRGAPIWAGGKPDTWRDLVAEYRRAAQQAADRGDFRRAALIYAKLLNDYRAAGEVLTRGGLHREAGIIFRDKVKQFDRAAREFDLAGEHDEALRLYREAMLFIDAGDLLRRLGDDDAAFAEYHKAAERAIELRNDWAEAGDLIMKKTGRADLAVPYFDRGWVGRTESTALSQNSVVCATRLLEILALAEEREPFWKLLSEAEEWLQQPGWVTDAGRFFNAVSECARLPHLTNDRGELRDRARLGLALKVRQHAEAECTLGTIVSDLLSASGHWSPSVVSDAHFALHASTKKRPKDNRPIDRSLTATRLHVGEVRAIVQAFVSGDLFVGFRDGTTIWLAPQTNQVRTIRGPCAEPVYALATDSHGLWLVDLRSTAMQDNTVLGFVLEQRVRRDNGFQLQARADLPISPEVVQTLLPEIDMKSAGMELGVSTVNGLVEYSVPGLIPHPSLVGGTVHATMHLKLRIPYYGESFLLIFQGGGISWGGAKAFIGWMPERPPDHGVFCPPIAWLVTSAAQVELAGLFDKATLYWTEVGRYPDQLMTRTIPFIAPGGFRAVAIWRPGQVVGVTAANRVLWLRARGNRFEEWAPSTDLNVPVHAAGIFPSRKTNEMLVVMEDGSLVRVAVPG
ncbi:MAG TPA: tetratricopeptide repeat protein [Gemmataceae bacterium]|jgi:tetratricopeptide (TPR) repeat protein|nr:tetratricopeptide repeat protein [Gemmataceae bacterium]